MLVIRSEQMERLRRAASRQFDSEMVRHLYGFAPRHCEVVGEACVREAVALGRSRADGYGFTRRGPVRFYLELMFQLGSGFDTDPQLPWAAGLLRAGDTSDQMDRADRLHAALGDYLDRVAGPGNAWSIAALRRLRAQVDAPPAPAAPGFEAGLIAAMHDVYPEKAAFVGDAGLTVVIRAGAAQAAAHDVRSERGRTLFAVLMFALGHGFADDPLFPWIRTTLADTARDGEQRARRLERRAVTYLDHVLAHLGAA